MANIRQYIGARYVFKIYENSQDPSSAEWESGVTYEPLTIVTYLNSTYASKKDVPGSVGDPASNPAYWVVTGAYNGQIAALQQQIDTINNTTIPNVETAIQTLSDKIDAINNDIVLFGDSWSTPAPNGEHYWCESLAADMGINIYNYAWNGVSYCGSTNTMQDRIDLFKSDVTNNVVDASTIKKAILFGSINDFMYGYASANDIAVKIKSCIDSIKTDFPDMEVVIVLNCPYPNKFGGNGNVDYSATYAFLFENSLLSAVSKYAPTFGTMGWFNSTDYTSDQFHIAANNANLKAAMCNIIKGYKPSKVMGRTDTTATLSGVGQLRLTSLINDYNIEICLKLYISNAAAGVNTFTLDNFALPYLLQGTRLAMVNANGAGYASIETPDRNTLTVNAPIAGELRGEITQIRF